MKGKLANVYPHDLFFYDESETSHIKGIVENVDQQGLFHYGKCEGSLEVKRWREKF